MKGQMVHLPSQGVSLFVKQTGDGLPLVLMHGGLGADHSMLLPMASCRDRLRLIFYDHRCNGRSAGPALTSMTWDNLTLDAEALREALGIQKWAVLGHSIGGMIALEYALRFPNSVTRLVLLDTGADASLLQESASRVLAERGYSDKQVEDARRLFNGEIAPRELTRIVLSLGKAYYSKPGPIMQVRALLNALRIRSRPEVCVFGFQSLLKGWSVKSRLKEITVPVLVIAGKDDFQFPADKQMELARALPNARCELIEGASHNPLIERPKQSIALIKAFVKEEVHQT